MKKFGVPEHKIMGFGSDGANVMTGGDGTTGRLLRKNPHLINVQCMAHRQALCTSQAAEIVPGMAEFHDTIVSLFYYFRNAPARVARFSEIPRMLYAPELRIREVDGVRWLSFYEVLEVVYRSSDPLLAYLKESKDPKAIGLRKKRATIKFVFLAYRMMDIILVVTKLSQYFQKQNIDIAQLQDKVRNTVRDLELLRLSDTDGVLLKESDEGMVGHYHKLLLSDLKRTDLPEYSQERSSWTFKEHEVTGCPDVHILGTKRAFIDSIISNIQSRFPDCELVGAFGILAMPGISLKIGACLKAMEMRNWRHSYSTMEPQRPKHGLRKKTPSHPRIIRRHPNHWLMLLLLGLSGLQ